MSVVIKTNPVSEKKYIEVIVERGIINLLQNQPNIFKFTSETNQTEWNLAHHLANEISRFFPSLDCDLEIIKNPYENKRPDIILHERGSHSQNFLVIELKKDGTQQDVAHDLEKIRHYWFLPPLSYQFGVVINLKSDKAHEVKVIENK